MQFKLMGLITPKARPRVHNKVATLPLKYREWKNEAIYQLWRQKANFDPDAKPHELHIVLIGKHHRGSDLSNIFGAIEDALVQAKYLTDDSMMYLTKISGELKHSQESPYTLITLS